MPILENDPWRMQYFESIHCPDSIVVPTEDADAVALFSDYADVYDKFELAGMQGVVSGRLDCFPSKYPVIVLPRVNYKGMARNAVVLRSLEEYKVHIDDMLWDSFFWSEFLFGDHVTVDVAVVDGKVVWGRAVLAASMGFPGVFDFWKLLPQINLDPHNSHKALVEWYAEQCLQGYTGMVNFEMIGDKIIEVHLRFSDQWVDLYGKGFMDAVVCLYYKGVWGFNAPAKLPAFSVCLYSPQGIRYPEYKHPPQGLVDELVALPGISSIQNTFHEGLPVDQHAMPNGWFRRAVLYGWDLEALLWARQAIAQAGV